jgi:hypothetical protein
MGELRERRRVALPLAAGIGGMLVPVAIFLAVNGGSAAAHGWGVAMSTDTAFALGVLALVGKRLPDRLRAFMLTVAVVDDIVALLVIAVAYSDQLLVPPPAHSAGSVRRDPPRGPAGHSSGRRLRGARGRHLAGAVQVRGRTGGDRARHGPVDVRLASRTR